MPERGSVDLLYLACNRLEFTRETFTTLVANTDWQYVHELFVYDDGSIDGTREWLEANAPQAPASVRFIRSRFGSPVACMVDFIQSAGAPILAKTDNDAMLPPGWLHTSLEALDRHSELSLLGLEAMYPHSDDMTLPRTYTAAPFISGLGLYRRDAFSRSRPEPYEKWFGLEEWQMYAEPHLVRGWITPALPVFLLDRYPFEPWIAYSCSYIQRGFQRSWPKYDKYCTLWKWRWPEWVEAAPGPDARFLCAMRIKNEGNHIHEVLTRALELCGHAVILDDHSTDNTPEICRSFGDRVTLIASPFEGLDEARDKEFLLQEVIRRNPEWVLWIDGDEVLEKSGPEKLRQAADRDDGAAAYSLRVAYLWDDGHHVRVDGIYGHFRRPSFFRLKGQPVDQLHFPASGQGANFHCGNVPRGLAGSAANLDVRLKHYGYMLPGQRMAKYEWYTTIDPNNQAEDCYRHLAGVAGARFAPGPPVLAPWEE